MAERSSMALMNHILQPQKTLSMLVSFPTSYGYRDVWNFMLHQLVEPKVDEKEHAMEFMTDVTTGSSSL